MAKTKAKGKPRAGPSLWKSLGPGLISGAADDDPSGIATYSQAGAAFGYGILWTVFLTFPLMVGIQAVSARIGRVTGRGLAANIRQHHSRALLYALVGLLLIANTINLAADIGAIAAAMQLLLGGDAHWYAISFALASLLLQIFLPFPKYAPILKALTMSLLAYVATVFVIDIPWSEVAIQTVLPEVSFDANYVTVTVAVLGTTISPYLFFWQASQEVEELRAARSEHALKKAPEQGPAQLRRIKLDTVVGMAFSNLIAFFIILTAAAVFHAHGVTDIETSAQAAEALRPLAGDFAFLLFAAGIVGTGLLAVPVLAGSAAYAVAETFNWRQGLNQPWSRAKGFYAVLTVATLLGIVLNFTSIDPMKALFWSAVINGVISVPIMAITMSMAGDRKVMGDFVIRRVLKILGWAATISMGIAVLLMGITNLV